MVSTLLLPPQSCIRVPVLTISLPIAKKRYYLPSRLPQALYILKFPRRRKNATNKDLDAIVAWSAISNAAMSPLSLENDVESPRLACRRLIAIFRNTRENSGGSTASMTQIFLLYSSLGMEMVAGMRFLNTLMLCRKLVPMSLYGSRTQAGERLKMARKRL